jgi:hypothetical protein
LTERCANSADNLQTTASRDRVILFYATIVNARNQKTKKEEKLHMENQFHGKIKVMGIHVENRRENIMKYVKQGSKFVLTREPENEYDKNAILIELPVRGGKHKLDLGYVPKETAAEIAPLIDSGIEFKATFRVCVISEKTGKLIHLYLNLIRVG